MHGSHGDLQGVDLNLVLALDALLAEQHVTRAAQRLGITQSAASHALARLREHFGDPLLVRGPKGAMLTTPLAADLAPNVARVLDELAAILRGQDAFDPAAATGAFHIGGADYLELVLLPRLVSRFAAAAPGIDLWMHAYSDWGDEELATGKLDLVIGPPRTTARPARSYERVLFKETFTCVMREGHPLADQRLTLARYTACNHVMVAPRGTPGSLVDDALAKEGKVRRVAVAVPHFLIVPYVVAGTDMIATLPTRIADLVAPTMKLARAKPPIELEPFGMSMAWHERKHADRRHRWLREQVLDVASEVA